MRDALQEQEPGLHSADRYLPCSPPFRRHPGAPKSTPPLKPTMPFAREDPPRSLPADSYGSHPDRACRKAQQTSQDHSQTGKDHLPSLERG